ncbi:TPA: hypothetical protein QCI70_001082 [Enterobacter ludwigii]|nr:hypothetical protein [Enterobacter ludwigii]HDR2673714.1 hypothetical protein [Enterobacter ludwigii]
MTKQAILKFICGFKPRSKRIALLRHFAQRRGGESCLSASRMNIFAISMIGESLLNVFANS